jgi:gliding motility-associated-like protein
MLKSIFQRLLLLLLLFSAFRNNASATHLMGGELTYTYDGSTTGGHFYLVKLIVYRYCDQSGGNTAQLDNQMMLGLFINDTLNPTGPKVWYATEMLILSSSDFVVSAPVNSNCSFTSTACIERGEYYTTILIPDNPGGYHLMVERCCRNGNIVNIDLPSDAGMTFYTFIPTGIINSTPQISDISVPYVCLGDTTSLINNAFDPDGDSLAYSFAVPFNGYSGPSNAAPDPMLDNNPYILPIPPVQYASGYNFSSMLGAGGYASIDPLTGLTKYYFPNQGFYVAAIEIKEYRNGILISSIRRDIQFISIACTPNALPQFNPASNGSVYTIPEGQQLCFNISFSDPDGDSLYLQAAGSLLDPLVVNPAGTCANAAGDSVVSTQFCWTPVCGMSRSTPYQFSVSVQDNGCPSKITNQVFSVYVTNGPSSLVPTVSISQFPAGNICNGSSVKFLANATLGGSQPHYVWHLNGVVAGTDSLAFNAGQLFTGDVVDVTLISNASCALEDTVFSPPFIANVLSQPAPAVTIISSPSTVLCPQQICLFTATVANGGANPVYQWYINGATAGTNQPAFTAASPSGIMSVYVEVTPSTGCPAEASDAIVFNIVPTLAPEVTLNASILDSICPGQQVMFTAAASNTGLTPAYSWSVNGVANGIVNDTIFLSSLQEGDIVNVSATSSYQCLSPQFAYADPLVYHIYPPLAADMTDGPISICKGLSLPLENVASGGRQSTYSYIWSTGDTEPEILFKPSISGYYYATVTDLCYGAVHDSVYVEVLPVPTSDFKWNPLIPDTFFPEVNFIDLSVDAVSWNWELDENIFSDDQNPSHVYTRAGIHPVTLITYNTDGCTDTLVQMLDYNDIITSYIPNSFTPNGDGINDYFGVNGFSTGGYTMSIYNRWGEEIFESAGINDTWNGNDRKGNAAPAGSYVYLFTINKDKKKNPVTGTVTLIR